MKNKIFYSAVILGNLNNIRCTEDKVKLIKYVVNNKVFTGGTDFKFKTGELKIKDIIDIDNVRKKACKKYLPNNKLDDLSTPDESDGNYTDSEQIVNTIFYDNLNNNKLKLIKVEKIKYTKENTGGKETIKEEKTEYNEENNHLKDGKLVNLEELIEKDTDYIFYYNYEIKFPTNSLHIMYNNVEYTNKDEIKLDCNLKEDKSNIDNFFDQIKDKVVNSENKKLEEELDKKTSPIHVLTYDMNYNIDCNGIAFQGDDTFYEQLLLGYNEHFVSLYLMIDQFYKYKIIPENIKGYNFKYDKRIEKIITELNKHKDQQFTEDSLNNFIKKDLFLKDGYYKLTFKNKLDTDKKINEDNIIRIDFDIDKIKNDNDSKQFISTYLKEKQYVYKYRITNIPYGYKIKSDKLKNTDKDGRIKGKLNNLNEVKAKIKEDLDLDLEDGEYELENITDLEKDFNNDSERIEINIKIKNDDKLKDKMFEKIPQKTTNDKVSKTSNRKDNGDDNGDNKGGNKNGCCGSNN